MGEIIARPEIAGAPRELGRPATAKAAARQAMAPEVEAGQHLRDENLALHAALQRMQDELDAVRAASAADLARLREGAAREQAAVHARAAQAGFEEGHGKGLAEGREAARAQAASRSAEVDKAVRNLAAARAQVLEQAETMVVESIFAGICRVVGALALEPRVLRASIAQARAAYGADEGVIVRIHPADHRLLCETAAEAGTAPPPGLQADERVGPGGCIVAGPEGELDARLESQLALLIETLAAARRSAGGVDA